VAEELAAAAPAIAALGGGASQIVSVQLPETEPTHYLVVIDKAAATAPRYPRRAGMPAKRPL
jgi:16S rRNA (guanine527-N7)-methyltransferase